MAYSVSAIMRSDKGYSFDLTNGDNIPLVQFVYSARKRCHRFRQANKSLSPTLNWSSRAGWRLIALLRLQIVRLAKPGRDSFRSYPGVLRVICGDDSHLPAGFRIGAYLASCPSSARPSLIISANSSAAILVFCMAWFQCSHTVG